MAVAVFPTRPRVDASNRVLTLAGLLLTLLLAALDATIVGTALPRIITELGGVDRYTWIVTAYLLTSTTLVPISGKLADQFGRKPLLVLGTTLFLAASILCAAAQTLPQLIAARAFQGLGGGMITAAAFAAVPTLFAPASRARIVGLFTGTYGAASIIGPLLGGVLTDVAGWRAVFLINIPLGAIALGLVWRTFPSPGRDGGRPAVDIAGAILLVGALTPLLLALSVGGNDIPWLSAPMLALLVAGLILLALFVRVETAAREPIVPLDLLLGRAVGIPTLGMATLATGLFATSLFTPLFVQGVLGASATGGGSLLAPLMIGFVLASVLIGQLIARVGRLRWFSVAGLLVAALGVGSMASLGTDTESAALAAHLVCIGLGLGCALAAFAVAAQNAVEISRTGVATALGTFARATGSTVGSAAYGGLLAARTGNTPLTAMAPGQLADALHETFLVAAGVLALGALAALLLQEMRAPNATSTRLPVRSGGGAPTNVAGIAERQDRHEDRRE